MNFTQKGIVLLLGRGLNAALLLVTGIILSRALGVTGVGQYQLVLSVQVIIITILAMGGGNASIYFINSLKVDKVAVSTSLLKFYTPIALLLSLVMFLSLMLFKDYFGELNKVWIVFFSIGAAFLLLYNILTPVLLTTLEILKYQLLGLASAVVFLIGILVCYVLGAINVSIVLFLLGLSNIIALFLFFALSKNYFDLTLSTDYSMIKKILVFGIKISAVNLIYILSSNIVIFLLNLLLEDGFGAIGLFSRASSIVNIFILFPSTLGALFYSKWASIERDKLRKDVEKTLRLFICMSAVFFLLVLVFGDFIIKILYGEEFLGAKYALNILQLSVIFTSVTIVFINLFSGLGKPMILLKTYAMSLIITCVLSLILIPISNIQGAAVSVLIGIIFNAFALGYYTKKEIHISISDSLIIRKEDIINMYNSIIERRK